MRRTQAATPEKGMVQPFEFSGKARLASLTATDHPQGAGFRPLLLAGYGGWRGRVLGIVEGPIKAHD